MRVNTASVNYFNSVTSTSHACYTLSAVFNAVVASRLQLSLVFLSLTLHMICTPDLWRYQFFFFFLIFDYITLHWILQYSTLKMHDYALPLDVYSISKEELLPYNEQSS